MLRDLENYIKENENKVIAIEGPSGTGKSTLSEYLESHYDVVVIHMDDYFLPPERKTEKRLSEPGGNVDYERLEKEVFLSSSNNFVISNHFNCQTNVLEKRDPMKKKRHIIIEGVYSMHPRFKQYIDYSVFMEIPREEQLKRILERSGAKMLERFKNEWIPLEDQFYEYYKVKEVADLVLKFT